MSGWRPALRIAPDDGKPVDEEHIDAIMADGLPEPHSDLTAIRERLRACKRPALCVWTEVFDV